ncbi:transmembrane protein, partial [Cavenderia fasciculata]
RMNGLFYFVVPLFVVLMILWVQRSDTESGMMSVIIYFIQTFLVISSGISFYILALINLQFDSGATAGSNTSGSAPIFSTFCPGPFDFYDRHYITIGSAPLLIYVLLLSTGATVILSKCWNAQKNRKYRSLNDQQEINQNDQNELEKQLEQENLDRIKREKEINNSKEQQQLIDQDEDVDYYNEELEKEKKEKENDKNKETTNLMGEGLPTEVHIKSTYMSQQFGSLVKLLLNIYSPIATSAFTMFFCETIGAHFPVLATNPAITCDGERYGKALIVSYTLFTVIIGFPIIIFVLLFRNRDRRHEPRVIRIYGVFFLKYKDPYYFWDVILLLRRLGIVLMSMMPPTSSTRSLLLVVVTLVSVLLQIHFKPFKHPQDNQLEFTSLSLLFICAVFLDNPIYQSIEQWVVIGSASVFAIHVFIIIYLYYRAAVKDRFLHYLYIVSRTKFGRPMSLVTINSNNSSSSSSAAAQAAANKLEKKPLISMHLTDYGSMYNEDEYIEGEMDSDDESQDGRVDHDNDQFDSLLYIK